MVGAGKRLTREELAEFLRRELLGSNTLKWEPRIRDQRGERMQHAGESKAGVETWAEMYGLRSAGASCPLPRMPQAARGNGVASVLYARATRKRRNRGLT